MRNKTCIYLLSVLLSLSMPIAAQQLVFEEEVDWSDAHLSVGPNQKHFWESRLLYGLYYTGDKYSYPFKFPSSGEFEVMGRYKYKLSSIFSSGISLAYLNQHFKINREGFHPDDDVRRVSYKIHSVKPAVFIRLNIDPKRGEHLGNYIDGGLFSYLSFSMKKIIIRNYDENHESGIRRSKEIHSGLEFMNRFHHGAFLNFGIGNYELSYRYRLSNSINEKAYPDDPRIDFIPWDLPKHSLGLSIRLAF